MFFGVCGGENYFSLVARFHWFCWYCMYMKYSEHCSCVAGQKDTELSEKGIHQAKLLGQRLQFEKFTHVFSSDLQRALKVRKKRVLLK